MEQLIGYERVIIIDALQTDAGSPSAVSLCRLEELPDYTAGHTTAVHDTSLQTALQLGRQLGADLPVEIMVVGVAVTSVYDFSEALTPAVAAVPAAVTAVLEYLTQLEKRCFHEPDDARVPKGDQVDSAGSHAVW